MSNKLNVYFPLNNLNPQGWISEFITPVIVKSGKNKDTLSHLFYNSKFDSSDPSQADVLKKLRASLGSDEAFKKYINLRSRVGDLQNQKMTFLNGNHLDVMEVDETLKGPDVTDAELQKYILFMSSAKPYQLAFLQSYFKISYGYRSNKKEPFTWVDFPFTQKYDLDFILNEKTHARAEGSGLTNASIVNKFNLATHVNSEISLNFLFGSMKILTQEIKENGSPLRKDKSSFPYGFNFMKLVENLDFTKEAIRIEYGKKVAPGFDTVVKNGQELKTIIENREKKVYLLNKYNHTFSFDEQGIVSIGVKYYNFHDTSLATDNNVAVPSYTPENIQKLKLNVEYGDMLKTYTEAKKQVKLLETQLKEIKSVTDAKNVDKLDSDQRQARVKDITKKLAKTNKNLNLLKRSLKATLTTTLLDAIKQQGQLFSVNFNTSQQNNTFNIKTVINLVDPDSGDFLPVVNDIESTYSIQDFKKNSKIQDLFKINKKGNEELLSKVFARIFNSPYDNKAKNSYYGNIMFFPLRALFTAAFSFLDDTKDDTNQSEKEKIPDLVFANVLMKVGDRTCSVNIGDLLIEAGVFQKWYYNKFYKTDKLDYPFGTFITDVIKDLIPEALYRNRVGFDDKAPTTAVKKTEFYLKKKIDVKLKENLYLSDNQFFLKQLTSYISKNPTNDPMPLLYFGQINNKTTLIPSPLFSKYGNSKFDFNELNDSKKGIMHIKIGADGGIVTKVDFQTQDFKLIRSALAFDALADKASRYFFFYYQLGITTLGSNMFAYDSVICVPSNPLGIDSEINDPGIAGYYKVKETTDTFDANNSYMTTAKADWFYNPKNDSRDKRKADIAPVSSEFAISDYVPSTMTDPVNYVVELLENDAYAIINAQLQRFTKPEKKSSEKAKKDKNPKQTPANNVDRSEKLGAVPTIK